MDSKIQAAEAEIRATLKKFGVAGTVVLSTEDDQHLFYEFPKWSIFNTPNTQRQSVSMRFDPSIYPNKEAENKSLFDSVTLARMHFQYLGAAQKTFRSLLESLEQHLEVTPEGTIRHKVKA